MGLGDIPLPEVPLRLLVWLVSIATPPTVIRIGVVSLKEKTKAIQKP